MSTTTYVFMEKFEKYQQFLVEKKKVPYLKLCINQSCMSRGKVWMCHGGK